ncbi:hypothetical protein J7K24_02225 [bacterium]|nr:hypothetical protein [bacterium]
MLKEDFSKKDVNAFLPREAPKKRLKATITRDIITLEPVIRVSFLNPVRERNFYLRTKNITVWAQRFSNRELGEIYADCLLQIHSMPDDDIPPTFKKIMEELEKVVKKRQVKLSIQI